jgi:hypothetical protein
VATPVVLLLQARLVSTVVPVVLVARVALVAQITLQDCLVKAVQVVMPELVAVVATLPLVHLVQLAA